MTIQLLQTVQASRNGLDPETLEAGSLQDLPEPLAACLIRTGRARVPVPETPDPETPDPETADPETADPETAAPETADPETAVSETPVRSRKKSSSAAR